MNFRKRFQTAVYPPPLRMVPIFGNHVQFTLCMHFILSGPRTFLHIFGHIHYKKKLQHYFPKMRWRQRREESIEISNSIEAALILTLCHWLFVKGMVPHDMQCPFTFEPLIHCLQLPHCDSRVKITREKNVDHRVKGWEKAPHLC